MNATRETVEPAMRAAAEDVCGEYMDVIPSDTRNLMGFYVSLRKLLVEVRLHFGTSWQGCSQSVVWHLGLLLLGSTQAQLRTLG